MEWLRTIFAIFYKRFCDLLRFLLLFPFISLMTLGVERLPTEKFLMYELLYILALMLFLYAMKWLRLDRPVPIHRKDGLLYVSEDDKIRFKNGVTPIPNYVFSFCGVLKCIKIPTSVTSIGNYAFYGCAHLANITIPDSVTSIGRYALANCANLAKINYGSSRHNGTR